MSMYARIRATGTKWEPQFTVTIRNIDDMQPIQDLDQHAFASIPEAEAYCDFRKITIVKTWGEAIRLADCYADRVSGHYRIKGVTDRRRKQHPDRTVEKSLLAKHEFEAEFGPVDWSKPDCPPIEFSQLPPLNPPTQNAS